MTKCRNYVNHVFVSRKSKGLSGRALRKLPFLTHALFVKVLNDTDVTARVQQFRENSSYVQI